MGTATQIHIRISGDAVIDHPQFAINIGTLSYYYVLRYEFNSAFFPLRLYIITVPYHTSLHKMLHVCITCLALLCSIQ